MRMIQFVKAHPVAYCIVHKVDRLARHRADDGAIVIPEGTVPCHP